MCLIYISGLKRHSNATVAKLAVACLPARPSKLACEILLLLLLLCQLKHTMHWTFLEGQFEATLLLPGSK